MAGQKDHGTQIMNEAERIKRNGARMNRLIGDLVDVASIDAGKFVVVPQPGDLMTLASEAVDSFHAIAAAKGISLELDFPGSSMPAEFDHDRPNSGSREPDHKRNQIRFFRREDLGATGTDWV